MPPRPFYRWKSFGFGIVMLAFLGWAWVASMRHVDVLYWNTAVFTSGSSAGSKNLHHFLYRHFGSFVFTAGQVLGAVEITWDSSRPSPLADHWSHQIITLTPKETWFARAVKVEHHPGQFRFAIAHWLLILLFLIPWLAFLVWRGRGRKRLGAIA
ncbi:MAG: hypothetical protein EOP84_10650 [Verrucomicrobiaceae bacterium]|nr:MAG: hypothetical protein EOP84_10650 [Verrucomicrobiaceae bacterium]